MWVSPITHALVSKYEGTKEGTSHSFTEKSEHASIQRTSWI